ncbi:dipeptide transport system permease protein [Renibacterium salmoninarum ATCC 33209]|uniref:Dipeptide transport system permease protein n=1 Tax=Renibacterium salmoninarum (strain ATCC 33209 / DSM 20767 / JCM 11484 / NBRC 15589 / NCIMB 2235) TaxID=288705 RepID=A9WMR7_RENSM|nr:dipeptide transport system permease protein [Renibacterium salmoninarum ATCC 33209]
MTALVESPIDAKPPSLKKVKGPGLGKYILIRFLLIIPTIFILVSLVFFLMRVIGDPITVNRPGVSGGFLRR